MVSNQLQNSLSKFCLVSVLLASAPFASAFSISSMRSSNMNMAITHNTYYQSNQRRITSTTNLHSTTDTNEESTPQPTPEPRPSAGLDIDHVEPEDAIIHIAPKAMKRLRELRSQQPEGQNEIILRMGVRNGGCSGLSYAMDFSTRDAIEEDDAVDEYADEGVICVVDAKSMLYLYGLELDYSDELIGGGFKFFNPNAEESCGCGSSFGV